MTVKPQCGAGAHLRSVLSVRRRRVPGRQKKRTSVKSDVTSDKIGAPFFQKKTILNDFFSDGICECILPITADVSPAFPPDIRTSACVTPDGELRKLF
ncbi:hypothetical protein N5923_22920 [Erwiniaceae bacterium BAC15a-03b]|uniref:Uncharacterized protein n=1 Tax=Winslowiella arboricola TaxID=2978220 RepID=A0A9J6PY16_9GAMM|nr:hypothetical protein [Winslowiella arboricola]MCU5775251.1 hypothetical protein [Winslowiella arboricola]MCU5780352.1 hypothetical protein [Winslowiella arboricola]